MPFESVEGIGVGCIVENTGHPLTVKVGEELLGHTLDGIGRPTDVEELLLPYDYPVEALPPDPMARKIIDEVLPLGIIYDQQAIVLLTLRLRWGVLSYSDEFLITCCYFDP